MLENLKNYNIILGSGSPRRFELLKGLHIDFEVKNIETDESYPDTLKGSEIPVFLAEKKSQAFDIQNNTLLITADTIVWTDNTIIGKPKNIADAKRILQLLSGRVHQVISGVCLRTVVQKRVFKVISDVQFAPLTNEEIEFYVNNFHPLDKAGAYGIQEWIGYIAVERISGSFYNIMGLPVQRLYTELKKF
ncbi:Maf-like protein [Bacteroidia bacterium]|nr:Maf-like protein [Bacteroidia bacterium]